ncbi:hypothetical protein N7523_002375 [Penicillium sp. IBT 18751x]|nr:hypothetical protein N7523_002375 [Penicillium sp. IBT 18751x]
MHFTLTAFAASSLLLASSAAAKAFNFENHLNRRAGATLVGCYSSSDGMGNLTTYTFQSSGWCYDRCSNSPYNAPAFALTAGSDCLCGNEFPATSDKVDSSKCNKPCDGWPEDMCGGSGFYSVYTTGLEANVPSYSDSDSESTTTTARSTGTNTATTKTSGATTSVSTDANGATTVVTATSAPLPSSSDDIAAETKSTHNTAAIAAGVVVGVVGLAALAGAVWFFYHSKKQKAEGFRGTAGGYVRESQPPSMTDSRFDGGYMAQRRQSNGSIDDDHDFSRRILQVTNPDAGRYH